MDAFKKVRDRVEQTVFETVGSASKTELDEDFVKRMRMAEDIKQYVEGLLAAFEKFIPHDERLISSFTASTHPADGVAMAMRDFARAIDKWPRSDSSDYCRQVFECSEEVFRTLSRSEKDYVENAAIHFIAPMKQFLAADVKKYEAEKKLMLTARVDMDYARNRVAKQENEQNVDEAAKTAAAFQKQKEVVEEEIRNLVRKLNLVRRSIATYVADRTQNLETSLEALRSLQKLMANHELEESAKKESF